MTAELGHFALWLALALALAQSVVPLIGAWKANSLMIATARPLALMQFALLSVSLVALAVAFYVHDFSIAYVANHSNSALPVFYRISAIWGGHEGSLLLWAWMLGGWSAAVALLSRGMPADMVARVLAVMGMVCIGFLAFMLFTSNPFDRLLPFFPLDGRDLNPLLQDPGLVVHPPMLYMGYVGFSVAFSFAVAGLLSGKLDPAWARWSRPWTTVAWGFLTIGIALGSWWAYYELGWGGWWFWDPVENASFMPWLAGTALIHSLAVSEKRNMFRAWTVLLAIITFALCLLGTFLVRSGILTSVHAFANDPSRGTFVLVFMSIITGGALLLFALRAPMLKNQGGFKPVSRESFLLGNNLLFITATLVVFIGTLFPLAGEAMDMRVSIGPPYFNLFFVPLTLLLMLIMVPGVFSNWKAQSGSELVRRFIWLAPASIAAGLFAAWLPGGTPLMGTLAFILVFWVVFGHLDDMLRKALAFRVGLFGGINRLSRGYKGMVLAHVGLAWLVAGVAMVSFHEIERDVRMAPGDSVHVGGYDFHFADIGTREGPNFDAIRGTFEVSRDGRQLRPMYPEKRTYRAGGQVMTQVALRPGLIHDLYVALGEPLDQPGAWAVRVYYKPGVRWLWLGALVMAWGAFLAVADRRYRKPVATPEAGR